MYSEKSNKELMELIDISHLLTFESQLSLRDEFRNRGIPADLSRLETAIAKTEEGIGHLEFLNDMGFVATETDKGWSVKRLGKAILLDLFSVIMGLVVFLIGVYGIASLVAVFVNGTDIDVFSLGINLAMASLVLTGFKFFNGLRRLFDFMGFALLTENTKVTLKKRFDLGLEHIEKTTQDLHLAYDDEVISLMLDDVTVFKANGADLVQHLTMERLLQALKK